MAVSDQVSAPMTSFASSCFFFSRSQSAIMSSRVALPSRMRSSARATRSSAVACAALRSASVGFFGICPLLARSVLSALAGKFGVGGHFRQVDREVQPKYFVGGSILREDWPREDLVG